MKSGWRRMKSSTEEARAEHRKRRELADSDRKIWKQIAEQEHLPQVKMHDWVTVEPVATKGKQEILTAVGRVYARAQAAGFSVKRIHSDRGREFRLYKTFSLADEHLSNGRAQGAIMRGKAKARTILQQACASKSMWPMAVSLRITSRMPLETSWDAGTCEPSTQH